MNLEKKFGELSEFTGREVELFRSSDKNQTAIYFTKVKDGDRETAQSYFEILRFSYEGGNRQIYVRFPNTDYFVEMIGGCGSGRGDMQHSEGKNIWEDEFKSQMTIYSHNNDLIFIIGKWEFNFMKRVAIFKKGENINYPEIEKALSLKYLKIPENIRTIEYCYKTKDENPKYFLVDYPTYSFQYENLRFFVIENEVARQYDIRKVDRYRDGGTTYIDVVDEDGNDHIYFSPTRFPPKTLYETYDDIELEEVTEEEKQNLIKLLSIEIEKKS